MLRRAITMHSSASAQRKSAGSRSSGDAPGQSELQLFEGIPDNCRSRPKRHKKQAFRKCFVAPQKFMLPFAGAKESGEYICAVDKESMLAHQCTYPVVYFHFIEFLCCLTSKSDCIKSVRCACEEKQTLTLNVNMESCSDTRVCETHLDERGFKFLDVYMMLAIGIDSAHFNIYLWCRGT